MDESVEKAELAPAALLNFRVTDAELFQPPYLSDELMGKAQTQVTLSGPTHRRPRHRLFRG